MNATIDLDCDQMFREEIMIQRPLLQRNEKKKKMMMMKKKKEKNQDCLRYKQHQSEK